MSHRRSSGPRAIGVAPFRCDGELAISPTGGVGPSLAAPHRLRPQQLPQWLDQQRAAGAACWALTAHPQAQHLPDFTFPRRTVLVLGQELTGIPPGVLEHCEGAIWIPQLGQVESLNVHVAGAIAAYSYLCQQGFA